MPRKSKPKTHRFSKAIVTEGRYKTYDRSSNKSTLKTLSGEDLEKTVETFNKLKEKGFKVPAPWKHDFDINTFTPVVEGESGVLDNSGENAGFWDSLKVETNEKGKRVLVGEIEAEGDPEDPNTPAGKIGKTVKDTSIYLRKEYEIPDDSGEKFSNVPMHIALVTHPIELNQKNFEKLPENDTYIAMSELVSDTDFGELSRLFKDVAGIFLPSNTTPETLVGNLFIALSQLQVLKEEETKEDGAVSPTQLEPVIMSNLSQAQIDALVASNVTNPDTNQPFKAEDFATQESPAPNPEATKAELLMSSMQSMIQDERRRSFRGRINSLVESRRVTKSYADEKLYPQAENYVFDPQKENAFDALVMSLEELPAPEVQGPTEDELLMDIGTVPDGSVELSEEEMDKIADNMLKATADF